MSLASGVWAPGMGNGEISQKNRKRSHSPNGNNAMKHPRMVVLKQGDGPCLGNQTNVQLFSCFV